MVARKRNYHNEEQRRNAIARALGFPNRAAMRKAIETGKIAPRRPKAVRSPKTIAAQEERVSREKPRSYEPPTQSDFERVVSRLDLGTIRQRNREWDGMHAKHDAARYDVKATDSEWDYIEEAKRKYIAEHGQAAYDEAYFRAFVSGDGSYGLNRNDGSDDLYDWFVDITDYLSPDDYADKYGTK